MIVKKMKQLIFIVLVFSIILTVFAAVQYQDFVVRNILWFIIGIITLLIFWKYDFIVMMRDFERAVIFRFGKVNRVGGPGWAIVFPPFEIFNIVDLRVQTVDIPKQDIVTKDNIEIKVDALIYLRVKKDQQSVINSVIEVQNYKEAVRLYVIALIRDICGSMTLSDVIENIEGLNQKIEEGVKEISDGWGIGIESVQIKDVDIPRIVIDAMHAEKAAVQEKLARIEKAVAHKAEIDAVKEAAEQLSDKALAYYYIQALEKLGAGKSTKFIFPMELSRLAESIGQRASGASSRDMESLFEKYAPAIKDYLAAAEGKERGVPKQEVKKELAQEAEEFKEKVEESVDDAEYDAEDGVEEGKREEALDDAEYDAEDGVEEGKREEALDDVEYDAEDGVEEEKLEGKEEEKEGKNAEEFKERFEKPEEKLDEEKDESVKKEKPSQRSRKRRAARKNK
jgi:regulator of protease activity HflC (stomatin/prohibitin superfamily)